MHEYSAVVPLLASSVDRATSFLRIKFTSKLSICHCKRKQDDDRLDDVFSVPYRIRETPYLTPPYLLNTPDIVMRDLHPASGEQLKFVVLATDGCELTSFPSHPALNFFVYGSVGPYDFGRSHSPSFRPPG